MFTPNARHRRLHRARAANYLATLNSSCSVDELRSIDWLALESLPHWCFLADEEKRRLRAICGALFYAPLMQRLIDRSRIQVVCSLVGQTGYQGVLNFTAPAAENFTELDKIEASEIESIVLHAGDSILLGAVQNPVIARVLQEQQTQVAPLSSEIAQPLYQHALTLYDSVSEQTTATDAQVAVVDVETTGTAPEMSAEAPQ